MSYYARILLVLVLSLSLPACAASGSSSGNSSDDGSSNRIVLSELSIDVGGMSAYDVINQYKPLWLQNPGKESIQNNPKIQVYVNNTGESVGSISSLKRIRATDVASIEYYSEREAQFKFGLGNSAGAILVHTKSGS